MNNAEIAEAAAQTRLRGYRCLSCRAHGVVIDDRVRVIHRDDCPRGRFIAMLLRTRRAAA